jgi:hypothetical protein
MSLVLVDANLQPVVTEVLRSVFKSGTRYNVRPSFAGEKPEIAAPRLTHD